ncbi:MAG: helix-turn-helix transcriptional regulator [Gammaproteobacteria bacterium]
MFTEDCGKRIKFARNMLGLTRRGLEEKFLINVNTLQAWENGKVALTSKGAKKLLAAFAKLGLICSEDWLRTGAGSNPIFIEDINILPNEMNEDLCILREIEAFKAINPNPIVIVISDNGMEPIYSLGDFVAGNKKIDSEINSLIGANCIIGTYQGDTLIRKLLKSSNDNAYTLACINASTDQQPIIPDIRIKFAAKVVFHRQKENLE